MTDPPFDDRTPDFASARFARAGFPFPWAGYDEALEELLERAGELEGARVLELVGGQGDLSAHLAHAGCDLDVIVTPECDAERIRARAPRARILSATPGVQGWTEAPLAAGEYTHVLSAYWTHRLGAAGREQVLGACARDLLAPRGVLGVADVGFATEDDRDAALERWGWDTARHDPWCADPELDALVRAGLKVGWSAIGPCAGVLKGKRRR